MLRDQTLTRLLTLLRALRAGERMHPADRLPLRRILVKTEDYLEVFARFKRAENVNAVEAILSGSGLERFEQSQLGP